MTNRDIKSSTASKQAQEHFGHQLRSHRMRAERTVTSVAQQAGMSPSKLSRIELGRLTSSASDVIKIATALKLPTEIVEQLSSDASALHTRVIHHPESREVFHTLRQQIGVTEMEARCTISREFSSTHIPARLQSHSYMRARFNKHQKETWSNELFGGGDLGRFLVKRTQRQAELLDPNKHHMFLITESALRNRYIEGVELQEQYNLLAKAAKLPNVDIGIITLATLLPCIIQNDFCVFDDSVAWAETLTQAFVVQRPVALEIYIKTLAALEAVALKGADAVMFLEQLAGNVEDVATINIEPAPLPSTLSAQTI